MKILGLIVIILGAIGGVVALAFGLSRGYADELYFSILGVLLGIIAVGVGGILLKD